MKVLISLFLLFAVANIFKVHGQMIPFKRRSPNIPKLVNGETSRISNGMEVEGNDFPWTAALIITTGGEILFCSGSLISTDYIITSANCIDRSINIEVILGSTKLNDVNDPNRLILNSKESIVHDAWDPKTYENDIGLVKLPAPLTVTDNIKPIKLWPSADNYWLGFHVNITGWGKTSPNSELSNALMYTTTSVRDHEVCQYIYQTFYKEKTNLCIGGFDGKSMCSGDEGGAVTFESDYRDEIYLIAISSFSTTQSCVGRKKADPSVYTYIYPYLSWVNMFVQLPEPTEELLQEIPPMDAVNPVHSIPSMISEEGVEPKPVQANEQVLQQSPTQPPSENQVPYKNYQQ